MKQLIITCCAAVALLLTLGNLSCKKEKKQQQTLPKDILAAMPQIDPWMYQTNGEPAQWLGFKLEGKTLFEPINLILVDKISASGPASAALVKQRFAEAGFDSRLGHSSNYKGRMNGADFGQLPETDSNKAFSNFMWTFTNDHARLFGPYQKDNIYFWIGSVSRELGISHEYQTFQGAVSELERCLVQFANVKKLGEFSLDNTLNSATETTGDHTGHATVLQIQ